MVLNLRSIKAYVYRNPVDMRKGHDGLSSLVMNQMRLNLLSGAIFLFVSKSRKIAKALVWDGTGLVLIHKRLERGKFMRFFNLNEVSELTISELNLILEGSKICLPLSPKEFKLNHKSDEFRTTQNRNGYKLSQTSGPHSLSI